MLGTSAKPYTAIELPLYPICICMYPVYAVTHGFCRLEARLTTKGISSLKKCFRSNEGWEYRT